MINKKLDIQLNESLADNGFTEPTELQKVSIPKIKSGRDLICIAPDKSGKSLTVVVTVIQFLKSSLDDVPRAIILVPDKDHGQILLDEFNRIGNYTDLRIHLACDDGKIDVQKDQIYLGADVVIGTAKRLNKIYSLYALNLNSVRVFFIDDANEVIKSMTYAQIDRLAESLPKVQKVLFASEMTEWLDRFASDFMNTQEIIEFDDEADETETID